VRGRSFQATAAQLAPTPSEGAGILTASAAPQGQIQCHPLLRAALRSSVRTSIANTLNSKNEDRDRELDDRPGAAAQRAWERKRRRAGTCGSEQERRARARSAERRRLHYPLEAYDFPPLGRPRDGASLWHRLLSDR
jgi:hypothetical protein